MARGPRLALLSRGITGGGVQKMMGHLAGEFARRGYEVDLLVRSAGGGGSPPKDVRPVVLPKRPNLFGRSLAWQADPDGRGVLLRPVLAPLIAAEPLRYLPALVAYLRENRPVGLMCATTYLNLAALWARRLTGSATPILVSERDNLSENLVSGRSTRAWRWKHLPPLLLRTYPWAEAIVSVSDGVGDDLANVTGIARDRIQTIYNPVVTPELSVLAREPVDEPWLQPGEPPVILFVGRIAAKKDLPMLIRALAQLRRTHAARLVVIGEGPAQAQAEAVAGELGIGEHVRFLGWRSNPYAYMSRAAVSALPSRREGLPSAVTEALACGCPVVATDCPSGPAEILDRGRFGTLVPVGDSEAFARALAETLDRPPERRRLVERGLEFSVGRAADAYLAALGLPSQPDTEELVGLD